MIASKDVEALKRLMFCFPSMTVFAVLAGASVPGLPAILASFAPEYICLFRGELERDMAEVAPYLVVLEPQATFTNWLLQNGWGMNWGIFGISQLDLRGLGRHLRTFVQVCAGERSLYFRYYDPRVMRNYLPTCTAGELKTVFSQVILYMVEDSESGFARTFSLSGKGLVEERLPLGGSTPLDLHGILMAFSRRGVGAGTRGLVVRAEQFKLIAERIYVERMRGYINEAFPESLAVPPDEMAETIIRLTDCAAGYKLVLETHVAPFIVGAWVFGTNFAEKFLTVKGVLEDYETDCGLKAQWLWDFIDVTLGILEEGMNKTE